ncbi:MAG TPA: hypothetical protein VFW21_14285 [Mycobacterium sp.]|nr:hypothetical protein [Mycobacterium sp.]
MSATWHTVLIGGLLFAALWIAFVSMQDGIAEALADPTSARMGSALSRAVPLAVAAGAVTVLLTSPAISALTGGGDPHDIMSSAVAGIWLGYLTLAAVVSIGVIRLLVRFVSVRRAGTP